MKLFLVLTSLFALGNMEQPLHVYTSEEIRLDELAKLDELGNTGNDKKKAVDPKKENTGNDKKKAVDPRKENTGNDKEEAVDPEKKNTGYDKKKAVDLEEENTEEAVDPTEDNTGDDKKGVIDFKEENTGHKILIIIVHCLDHSILYQQRDFQRRAKKFPIQRGGAGGQDAVPLAPDRVRE